VHHDADEPSSRSHTIGSVITAPPDARAAAPP
jgi:hypothetical protein